MLYESLGAKLILMSFFVSIARAVEILLKPTIANISDNLISMFGRRKPFMFIGSFFYVWFLLMIFKPPFINNTTEYISYWFGVFYVLFFVADTIVNVPYLALGPEMSKSAKERERLYVYFYLLQYIGVLIAASGPVILANLLYPVCDCTACLSDITVVSIELCVEKCNLFCTLQSNLLSLRILSYIIGFEFLIAITLLCIFVKEKKSVSSTPKTKQIHNTHNLTYDSYENNTSIDSYNSIDSCAINEITGKMLPKLYQLMKNKPFICLLYPWVIDVTVTTIFATMMPFFLNVVINPQKYCKTNGIPLSSLTCNSQIWLGVCVSAFFISCIISMAGWHWLVSKYGKKACWKAYSLLSAFTFASFALCGNGDMEKAVFFSIICAIPAGGGYINDVNMTDAIDYDEFQTGRRNEAIYTVFISFIPKFVSVFAQALPISMLALLGFVSTQEGIIQDQDDDVIFFTKFIFIWVPCFLAFLSFLMKRNYPIESTKQIESIHRVIDIRDEKAKELKNKYVFYIITDPIFKTEKIVIFIKTEKQAITLNLFSHFSSLDYIPYLITCDFGELRNKMKFNIIVSCLLVIFFCLGMYMTFDFLEIQSLNFIPIIFIFLIAISIILVMVNTIRFSVVNSINEEDIDKEYMKILTLKFFYDEQVDFTNSFIIASIIDNWQIEIEDKLKNN